jgi:hypothetical protein
MKPTWRRLVINMAPLATHVFEFSVHLAVSELQSPTPHFRTVVTAHAPLQAQIHQYLQ